MTNIKKVGKSKESMKMTLMVLKYMFSMVLTLIAMVNNDNLIYLIVGLVELTLIMVMSNILMKKKMLGYIVNIILMLLYNAQMMVLMFASSYISMVMLTNLNSIEALSGKAGIYITSVVLLFIFSVLPIRRVEVEHGDSYRWLSGFLCIELAITMVLGNMYSPIYGYCDLVIEQYRSIKMKQTIANSKDISTNLYNEGVKDYKIKDARLPNQPNVILIFTEGLSQNIISDERNIMPTVKFIQDNSISFTNYYNHTFATYRGLIGQLYSGYQMSDLDSNSLISLQSVMHNQGYRTTFINTEPYNQEFSRYVKNFEFDELLGEDYKYNGMSDTISDKDAYNLLYDTAIEYSESNEPFFIAMYTFGTHASLDSCNEKFGDGSNPELNKFFDVDCQFGEFMNKFHNSVLAEDTIIVFTADHATYQDDSYNVTFPDHIRKNVALDEIPLFIYYRGMVAGHIDVNGRNSLCLAPTILDYLDISAPNYFLGTSLYTEEVGSIAETTHTYLDVYLSTKNGEISTMNPKESQQFTILLQDYYITKERIADEK